MREAEFSALTIVRCNRPAAATILPCSPCWPGPASSPSFPLFNRRIACASAIWWPGSTPRRALLLPGDLSERDRRRLQPEQSRLLSVHRAAARYLRRHGAESALRRRDVNAQETKREVARRIVKRIDWQRVPTQVTRPSMPAPSSMPSTRLQRGKLEKNMLFGIHRKDKHDRAKPKTRRGSRQHETPTARPIHRVFSRTPWRYRSMSIPSLSARR